MGRRAIPMSERQHGLTGTYQKGCRCEPCTEASRAYKRDWYAKKKGRPGVAKMVADGTLPEIRIPVSCPHCGAKVKQQTPSATTDSGLRVTVMLRCADKGCSRQWQFVGVLMSLSGAEYQGAA